MMRIRKISFIFLLLICVLLVGCGKKDVDVVNTSNSKSKYSDNPSSNINVNGSGELKCEREANVIDDLKGTFIMNVTYKDGNITVLHTYEKVEGDKPDSLTKFEDAYNKIANQYKDVEYYDITVTRKDDYVIFDSNVNYEKVDINKVIAIEGDVAKMFKDGKAKLKSWLAFAKRFGITCEGV